MAWELVQPLEDLTEQLNEAFPGRDKTSDGSIANAAHNTGISSHNADGAGQPGTPEHEDNDSREEVRAKDIDKDLRDPEVTMEMVIQHLLKYARAGVFWWIRYIIYRERIWHKRDGYKTHAYDGVNKHNEHAHVNSDFTQAADNASGVDYRFEELVGVSKADVFAALDEMLTGTDDKNKNRRKLLSSAIMNSDSIKAPAEELVTNPDNKEWWPASFLHRANAAFRAAQTVDGKVSALVGAVAELKSLQTGEESAEAERFTNLLARFATLSDEIQEIDEEVFLKLSDPETPDEQVAEALVQLLGNRKDAVIALMQ